MPIVRIVEHLSLEKEILTPLKEFIQSVGFSDKFPNFGKIRISTTHPFSLLLLESLSNVKAPVDLFPAITVADTSGTEDNMTLARDDENYILRQEEIARWRINENVITSEENFDMLQSHMDKHGDVSDVPARKLSTRSRRMVDFNIWGENHDLVSIIYDIVESFVTIHPTEGKPDDWPRVEGTDDDMVDEDLCSYVQSGPITGRRSGDINVDFGRILYGAVVSVPYTSTRDVIECDLDIPYPVTAKAKQRNF